MNTTPDAVLGLDVALDDGFTAAAETVSLEADVIFDDFPGAIAALVADFLSDLATAGVDTAGATGADTLTSATAAWVGGLATFATAAGLTDLFSAADLGAGLAGTLVFFAVFAGVADRAGAAGLAGTFFAALLDVGLAAADFAIFLDAM